MAEDWTAVAAEVEGALASIGDISQPDGYPATIRRAIPGTPDPSTPWLPVEDAVTYTVVRVLVSDNEVRDVNGTLIGVTRRTVTISGAAGIEPSDDDKILLGEALTFVDATDDATHGWQEIETIRPLSPAGVAVLFELDLAT